MRKNRKSRDRLLGSFLIGGAVGIVILSVMFLLINRITSLNEKAKYYAAQNESMSRDISDAELELRELERQNKELAKALDQEKNKEKVSEKPIETVPEILQTLDGIKAGTLVETDNLDLENIDRYFQAYEIKPTGTVYGRIYGKSYRDNPNVALDDLRYLKLLHYNFDHRLQIGELIVNARIAADVLEIFKELYEAEYEIQSMHLVDNYWTGDGGTSDSASIEENNTSAFNYRVVTGGKKLSNHAYGFAIDINPQQNPYVSYRDGVAHWSHENANDYIKRDSGLDHVITHEDLAFQVFHRFGFTWGGDWNNPKDYQHFEKKVY